MNAYQLGTFLIAIIMAQACADYINNAEPLMRGELFDMGCEDGGPCYSINKPRVRRRIVIDETLPVNHQSDERFQSETYGGEAKIQKTKRSWETKGHFDELDQVKRDLYEKAQQESLEEKMQRSKRMYSDNANDYHDDDDVGMMKRRGAVFEDVDTDEKVQMNKYSEKNANANQGMDKRSAEGNAQFKDVDQIKRSPNKNAQQQNIEKLHQDTKYGGNVHSGKIDDEEMVKRGAQTNQVEHGIKENMHDKNTETLKNHGNEMNRRGMRSSGEVQKAQLENKDRVERTVSSKVYQESNIDNSRKSKRSWEVDNGQVSGGMVQHSGEEKVQFGDVDQIKRSINQNVHQVNADKLHQGKDGGKAHSGGMVKRGAKDTAKLEDTVQVKRCLKGNMHQDNKATLKKSKHSGNANGNELNGGRVRNNVQEERAQFDDKVKRTLKPKRHQENMEGLQQDKHTGQIDSDHVIEGPVKRSGELKAQSDDNVKRSLEEAHQRIIDNNMKKSKRNGLASAEQMDDGMVKQIGEEQADFELEDIDQVKRSLWPKTQKEQIYKHSGQVNAQRIARSGEIKPELADIEGMDGVKRSLGTGAHILDAQMDIQHEEASTDEQVNAQRMTRSEKIKSELCSKENAKICDENSGNNKRSIICKHDTLGNVVDSGMDYVIENSPHSRNTRSLQEKDKKTIVDALDDLDKQAKEVHRTWVEIMHDYVMYTRQHNKQLPTVHKEIMDISRNLKDNVQDEIKKMQNNKGLLTGDKLVTTTNVLQNLANELLKLKVYFGKLMNGAENTPEFYDITNANKQDTMSITHLKKKRNPLPDDNHRNFFRKDKTGYIGLLPVVSTVFGASILIGLIAVVFVYKISKRKDDDDDDDDDNNQCNCSNNMNQQWELPPFIYDKIETVRFPIGSPV